MLDDQLFFQPKLKPYRIHILHRLWKLFFSASAQTSLRIMIQLWNPITCSSLR